MTTGRTLALPTFCRFRDHQSLLPAVVRGERGNPFRARAEGASPRSREFHPGPGQGARRSTAKRYPACRFPGQRHQHLREGLTRPPRPSACLRLRPRFALILGRQIAADEPVTIRGRNPAQRADCRWRHVPGGEQQAVPHVHMFVVGRSDRTGHHPDSQPNAPADPGHHFPDGFLERAVCASALARTMSGSRGSGASASSHGLLLRALRRPMRIRFITDLPKAIDRARPRPARARRRESRRWLACGRTLVSAATWAGAGAYPAAVPVEAFHRFLPRVPPPGFRGGRPTAGLTLADRQSVCQLS